METRRRNSAPASLEHAIDVVELAVQNMNQLNTSTGTEPSSRSQQNVNQTDTSTGPDSSSSMNNNERHPFLHLLTENYKLCLDLQKAAVEGDVDRAKSLLGENYVERLGAAITDGHETVLHVAAGAKQARFVEEMINLMEKNNHINYLSFQNEKGNTAFCFAAMAGSKPIAEAMLKKDRILLNTRGGESMTPLYLSALFGEREMASFLYHSEGRSLTAADKRAVFFISIDTTLYDLALELLANDVENEIAMEGYRRVAKPTIQLTPLHPLAQTPLHLLVKSDESDQTSLLPQALQLVERLWERILRNEGAQVGTYFSRHKDLLFDAAHLGNFEFLGKLIHLYPDLVHQLDENHQSIFHIAISHRHGSLFDLIYKTGFNKQLIAAYFDNDGNNLLHLAAKYPNQRPVSMRRGAALEMQLELKIFKEVESLVMPSFRRLKNENSKTPQELFTSTHADLLKKGEDWMRNTASQCMLVATLIATVVFAAYFSIPGGNDDQTGIPIHRTNIAFHIFAMADAIALSSSSISILMFLSILTSRYEENDFYRSLPLKLVVGLLTLSISLATMMVAFISSVFLAYNDQRINIVPVLSTIFVILPVFVYISSQYSLLREILYTSFRFRFSRSQ